MEHVTFTRSFQILFSGHGKVTLLSPLDAKNDLSASNTCESGKPGNGQILSALSPLNRHLEKRIIVATLLYQLGTPDLFPFPVDPCCLGKIILPPPPPNPNVQVKN